MARFTPKSDNPNVRQVIVNMVDSFTPERLVQLQADIIKGYDLDEFFDDLTDFTKGYQRTTGDFKDFSIKPDFSYASIGSSEGNSIRYKIQKRTYATIEQGRREHQGTLMARPMLVNILEDKRNPGYKVLSYAQEYDNTIIIGSWSKNYRDANRGAFLIEEIFDLYSYVFLQKGLKQLHFRDRLEDQYIESKSMNAPQYGALLQYYIRTNKVRLVYEKILEEIAINILKH